MQNRGREIVRDYHMSDVRYVARIVTDMLIWAFVGGFGAGVLSAII